MSYDYEALRDGTVARLIENYGVAAYLVRWTKGAYDVGTAASAAGSSADLSVTVVITDYDEDEIDGTLVKREDKKILIGGADSAPIMNDKLKIGSELWEIVRVKVTKPGDVEVLYEVQVRK